jgi:hypothetical protein
LNALEWARNISDNWKIKYYEGMIYLNAGAEEKGQQLWNACGNVPDYYPFYIARSLVAGATNEEVAQDMEAALKYGKNEWRAGLCAAKFYEKKGDSKKAEELIRSCHEKFPENYYVGLFYSKILEENREYTSGIELLKKMKVLPCEGATEGRVLWRKLNLEKAYEEMESMNYRVALKYIAQARLWPSNLGVGRPYEVDERLEDFTALTCYDAIKDRKSAKKIQKQISDKIASGLSLDSNDFLTAWLFKENGNKSEGDRIMKDLLLKNSSVKSIQWCNLIYNGDFEKAADIAPEVDINDDTTVLLIKMVKELHSLWK